MRIESLTGDGTSVSAGPDDDPGDVVDYDAVLEGTVRRQPTHHRRCRRHAQYLQLARPKRRIYIIATDVDVLSVPILVAVGQTIWEAIRITGVKNWPPPRSLSHGNPISNSFVSSLLSSTLQIWSIFIHNFSQLCWTQADKQKQKENSNRRIFSSTVENFTCRQCTISSAFLCF